MVRGMTGDHEPLYLLIETDVVGTVPWELCLWFLDFSKSTALARFEFEFLVLYHCP